MDPQSPSPDCRHRVDCRAGGFAQCNRFSGIARPKSSPAGCIHPTACSGHVADGGTEWSSDWTPFDCAPAARRCLYHRGLCRLVRLATHCQRRAGNVGGGTAVCHFGHLRTAVYPKYDHLGREHDAEQRSWCLSWRLESGGLLVHRPSRTLPDDITASECTKRTACATSLTAPYIAPHAHLCAQHGDICGIRSTVGTAVALWRKLSPECSAPPCVCLGAVFQSTQL